MIYKNKLGHEFKIIKRLENNRALIKFSKTGHVKDVSIFNIIKTPSEVKDPFEPHVLGIGFMGTDERDGSELNTKIYNVWRNLISRCYDINRMNELYYGNVTVCKEWHNYSNFKSWLLKRNYDPKLHMIDKDILGGNEYSPSNCIIIPIRLNVLLGSFSKRKRIDSNIPTGIRLTKQKTFDVSVNISFSGGVTKVYRKIVDNIELAFLIYVAMKGYYLDKYCDYLLKRNLIPLDIHTKVLLKYNPLICMRTDSITNNGMKFEYEKLTSGTKYVSLFSIDNLRMWLYENDTMYKNFKNDIDNEFKL